jgi:hypothetical protein
VKKILSRGAGQTEEIGGKEGLEVVKLTVKGIRKLNQDQRNQLYALWDGAMNNYQRRMKSYR